MTAALEVPSLPYMVGRYVLYGAIASGGMATVHFGRLVGPGGFARPVAIKRLHAQYARDPEFVEMFLEEARLAARIAHPNVVQTIDLVETGDEIFLVMDYVRGLAFSSLIRILKGKIPPNVALGIVIGILNGLHAAHEAKDDMGERLELVHRDVSPQNILVGTDGIARLLDFGIAKAARRSQSTRDGQIKGKMAYMAPEQIHGDEVTRRADIYAASVVLWEALAGKRLFYGKTDAESLKRSLSDEVHPPSSIVPELPPALDAIVMRGLERDASKRYATAHDMAMELSAVLAPAQPAEIGQWVERTAANELQERASRVAAIERSAAEGLSRLSLVPHGVGAPDAPTQVGKRALDHAELGTPGGMAGMTSATALTVTEGSRPRRTPWIAGVGVVAVLIAAGLFVMFRGRAAPPVAMAGPGVASTATAVSGHGGPSEPGGWTPAPAQPTPPSTATAESATAQAQAAVTAPPVQLPDPPKSTTTKTSSTKTKSTSSGAGKPGCDPPYTEDAQGHVHFKANCL